MLERRVSGIVTAQIVDKIELLSDFPKPGVPVKLVSVPESVRDKNCRNASRFVHNWTQGLFS